MTSLDGATWLVARRELREELRRKTTWIVGGLLLVGSTAAMVVPEIVGDDGTPTYEVVLVEGSSELREALKDAIDEIDATVDLSSAPSAAAAITRVEHGQADIGVVSGEPHAILARADEHERLVGAVYQALAADAARHRLRSLGLSDDVASSVLRAPEVTLTEVEPGAADRRAAAGVLSFAVYVLLFMLLMQVATGTAIEKSNRISEVLLGIVRPSALLFGKVLGVVAGAMLILSCGAVPVLVKLIVGGDLPAGLGAALLGGGAWFLLGVGLYVVLAGALGALAERQEEVSALVTPLNVVILASYAVGSTSPESPLAQVLAYIPLSAPMVMPSRIAVGAASAGEMALSLFLCMIAVVLAVRFGSIVYRRAIVRTGRRLKLREVLRGA